jgi:hypothetical protein
MSVAAILYFKKIKHLKIETVTYLFPKFTRMHGNVFDSFMPSFFCMHVFDSCMPSYFLHAQTWCGGRVGLDQVAGVVGLSFLYSESPGLLIYLPYIYTRMGTPD